MRARVLIPTGVVVLLAVVSPLLPEDPPLCPAGPDGPQFKCWLESQTPDPLEDP